MKNLRGPLLILLSSLLFSTTGTLQQVAPAGNTPIVITEIRMLLGAITLFLWCFFTKQFPFNMKKVAWKALFTAVIAVLLYQIFFLFIRWQTRCSSRFCHFDCDNTHLGSHPCLFTLQVKTKFFLDDCYFLGNHRSSSN